MTYGLTVAKKPQFLMIYKHASVSSVGKTNFTHPCKVKLQKIFKEFAYRTDIFPVKKIIEPFSSIDSNQSICHVISNFA